MNHTKLLSILLFAFVLCSLSIQQTEEDHADQQTHLENEHTQIVNEEKLTNAQVWGFGVLAGVGISCIGFLAAFVLVIFKRCCNVGLFDLVLKFLFSLSCGALIGDAVVHILAQAYENEETQKLIVSLIFILSIVFFIIVDRLLHALGISHSHWVGKHSHDEGDNHLQCSSEHQEQKKNTQNSRQAGKLPVPQVPNLENKNSSESNKQLNIPIQSNIALNPQVVQTSNGQLTNAHGINNPAQTHAQNNKNCLENLKGKGSAGYMNIFGSAIHNFFDGLALGIAFASADKNKIIPVIVAIIAHQIPRQLGDVAILLKSQFSQIQTVLCNGFVNFLSLIGVFIGLAIVNLSDLVRLYILVFVAGNFIYIAADIWQNILNNRNHHERKQNKKQNDAKNTNESPQTNRSLSILENAHVKNTIQLIGLGLGIGIMFLLTLLQSHDHDHAHQNQVALL